jgi:hypothetical protein
LIDEYCKAADLALRDRNPLALELLEQVAGRMHERLLSLLQPP